MNATMSAPVMQEACATSTATRTVLVIGDATSSRAILKSLNFEAQVVATAAEAVEAFRHETPDLCLVNLHLPDKRGLELLGVLRAANPAVPCVVIAPTRSIRDIFEAQKLGAVDYLVTPLDPRRAALSLDHAARS